MCKRRTGAPADSDHPEKDVSQPEPLSAQITEPAGDDRDTVERYGARAHGPAKKRRWMDWAALERSRSEVKSGGKNRVANCLPQFGKSSIARGGYHLSRR